MLRLVVLCLALTCANSRFVIERNFAQRDPLDDWRHLEANEIPNNPDDGYDFIPAELLLEHIRPEILLAEREEQLSDTTYAYDVSDLPGQKGPETLVADKEEQPSDTTYAYNVSDLPGHTYEPTDVVEEAENSTLPEYTEEADGYLLFSGIGRFKLHDDDLPWRSARDQCISEEGFLAIPDSREKVAIFMKMYEMHPEIPARAILRHQVYIGIEDPEHTRQFVTVKGDPVSIDNPLWAKGEPDNEPPGEEDCVTFRTDARIRDVPCHFWLPYFCEKPL